MSKVTWIKTVTQMLYCYDKIFLLLSYIKCPFVMMRYLCFLQYIKSGSSIKEVDKLHIDNMVEGIGMSVSLDKKSVYVVTSDMVNN